MRATVKGRFLYGRGYSFKDESGNTVEGGTVWLAHDDVDGPDEVGTALESYSASAQVFDALKRGAPGFGDEIEIDAEQRPGAKRPRAHSIRRVNGPS